MKGITYNFSWARKICSVFLGKRVFFFFWSFFAGNDFIQSLVSHDQFEGQAISPGYFTVRLSALLPCVTGVFFFKVILDGPTVDSAITLSLWQKQLRVKITSNPKHIGRLCERQSENEEGERWGNSFLLQLIFLKYFTWILAAVVLQKTKGNEPWLLEPKTTHSVRKSRNSYCLEHRERQSQSELLKSALGYMKHIGKKISRWKNICDVAGDKWFCHCEH